MKMSKQQKRALAELKAELNETKEQMKDLDAQIAQLSLEQDDASEEVEENDEVTDEHVPESGADPIRDLEAALDKGQDIDAAIANLSDEQYAALNNTPAMRAWARKANQAAVARLQAHRAAAAQAEKAKGGLLQSIVLAGITLGGIFGTALAVGKDKGKKKAR